MNNKTIILENNLLDQKNNYYDKIDYLYIEIQKLQDKINAIDYILTYGEVY